MTGAMHHSDSAEKSVLGAVLLRNDAFYRVPLQVHDFFDPRHRELWGAMQRLVASRKPIDPELLFAELGDRFDAVTVSECVSLVPTADNVEFYAEEVSRLALTRRVRLACSELAHSQLEGEELLQRALEVVTKLGARRTDGAVPMSDLAPKTLEQLVEQIAKRGQGDLTAGGLSTGLTALDEFLGGIKQGVVTVLGGRPSMGKSALARTIAQAVVEAGGGVHVFSLEDVGSAYTLRALSDVGRVDLHRLTTLQLAPGDLGKLDHAARDLGRHTRWLIDDVAGVSAAQIGMKVRRHITENQTRLVVVDYVQIMREPETRRGEKRVQVAASVEGLHELARRENVAVLLISQLNRKLEERDDKRPQMSDLREAGELEQIADAVLFCYRDEIYNREGPKGRAEVIIAKNKHGRPGSVTLVWDAATATYRNPVERQPWLRDREPGEDDDA